jgi:NhaP-type Na+/H+ or K+/H+ antiporter
MWIMEQKVFPYDWSWSTGLLLGGLLSATDPVAVVALLKELGASKKLSTLIEGESLMNDG